MEEKMFDLLTKMYNEMQDMKSEMKEMKQHIQGVEDKVQGIEDKVQGIEDKVQGLEDRMEKGFSKVNQDLARLESKVDNQVSALFDGYTQHTEQIKDVNTKVDKLLANQEKQDVEIKVIHTRAN